jgi:hypothetical protein
LFSWEPPRKRLAGELEELGNEGDAAAREEGEENGGLIMYVGWIACGKWV